MLDPTRAVRADMGQKERKNDRDGWCEESDTMCDSRRQRDEEVTEMSASEEEGEERGTGETDGRRSEGARTTKRRRTTRRGRERDSRRPSHSSETTA